MHFHVYRYIAEVLTLDTQEADFFVFLLRCVVGWPDVDVFFVDVLAAGFNHRGDGFGLRCLFVGGPAVFEYIQEIGVATFV